jgi:hypothetical protein
VQFVAAGSRRHERPNQIGRLAQQLPVVGRRRIGGGLAPQLLDSAGRDTPPTEATPRLRMGKRVDQAIEIGGKIPTQQTRIDLVVLGAAGGRRRRAGRHPGMESQAPLVGVDQAAGVHTRVDVGESLQLSQRGGVAQKRSQVVGAAVQTSEVADHRLGRHAEANLHGDNARRGAGGRQGKTDNRGTNIAAVQ